MALSTYDELLVAIPLWAWRTGDTAFHTAVPDFIALAEDLIAYGDAELPPIRTKEMEADDSIVLTDGVGALPADYLEYRAVTYGDDLPFATDEWEIVGDEIRTESNGVSPLTFNYYARVPALSPSNQTNWLIERNKLVYLYGAMIFAAPFMKNDARMGTWRQLYAAAITGLSNTDMRSRYVRRTVRTAGTTP